MSDRILRLRIPLTQEFVRKRCRNTETERFWDEGQVLVSTVEPETAPVAYRMSDTDAPAERRMLASSYLVPTASTLPRYGFFRIPTLRGLDLMFMVCSNALCPTELQVFGCRPRSRWRSLPLPSAGSPVGHRRRARVMPCPPNTGMPSCGTPLPTPVRSRPARRHGRCGCPKFPSTS